MKRINKLSLWLIGVATLACFAATQAKAATPAVVDVNVSISSSKSLAIAGSTFTTFGAMPISSNIVSGSSITIVNDSGAYIETYKLSAGNAISNTGGTNWTLALTTSTNQYALGAMFADAKPAESQSVWGYNNALMFLSGTPTVCTSTQFGNGVAGESGASVSPVSGSNKRYLWFQMHTPDVSNGTEQRTATVTVDVN